MCGNTLGIIVTVGGAGALVGASLHAWFTRAPEVRIDREERWRADAVRRLSSALDDLSGVPNADDVRLARTTIEGVVTMLDR